MFRNKILTYFMCLCLIAVFTGCERRVVQPLRVGTNVWPGYEPLYLARSLGYIQKDHIQLVELTSTTEVIRAFRNGAIEVAALTLDEALFVAQYDSSVRIVLVMDISNGADAVIGKGAIKTLADLKDKRIGVETTALGAYMLTRLLEKAGLKREDVKIISLSVGEHEEAFAKDKIDAVITFEPVRSRLLASGANKLFDSSQIPGEIVDVLVVGENCRQGYAISILKELVQGWFRALDYLKTNPREAADRMRGRLRLPVDDILASYQLLELPSKVRNSELLTGPKPFLLNVAEKLAAKMMDDGLLDNKPDVGLLFDQALLGEIYQ